MASGVSTIDTNGLGATFSGVLSGGGGLAKAGAGTLTLSGANTYAGGTALNAGTLAVGSNTALGAGALTFASGTTLQSAANGLLLTNAMTLNGADTVDTQANALTLSGNIDGTGALTKVGTGTLTLSGANTYAGGTALNAGTLAVGSNTALGTGTLTFASGTTLQSAANGLSLANSMTLNGTDTVDTQANALTLSAVVGGTGGLVKTGAGTLTLSGANTYSGGTALNAGTLAVGSSTALGTGALRFASGTTLQSAANGLSLANAITLNGTDTVDTQANVLTLSGIISGTGALTKIGTGTLTLAGTSTYSGGTALNAGTLAVGNNAALGTGALTFTTGTNLQAAANGLTLTNVMTLNGTDTVDTRTNELTLSGAISGSGGLVKTGAGSLTLTGTNSYTGGTTVNGTGFLFLGDAVTTGKIVGAVTNNAFFEIVNADTSAITTVTNNGSTTFDAGTSASSAAITNGGGSLLSFTGNSTAANATITTNAVAKTQFLDTSTGGNAQFITNAGGIVDFSGTSGPAGNNRITAGSIAGAGSYYLGANQLATGGNDLPSAVTGVISDCGPSGTECNASGATGGSLVKVGNATLTLTGTNTYSGGTTINSGILAVSSDANLGAASGGLSFGGGTLQYLAGFTSARTIVLNTGGGTFDTNGFTATLADPIGGTGGLTKVGAGELDLLGASSYAGATNVNAGTLMAGATNSFSAASAFTVGAGAFLDIGGFDQTIGSLAGAGTVQNGGPAAATLTTGGDNRSTTFSGVIQDCCSPLALTKVGTGTLTISGVNNTYTGATTVNGGTLAVTGDIRTSSGVTVNGGAILSGTGTVSNININAGGTLAAGLPSAPGTLTATGSLVLQAAATYLVQVSPATASRTAVTGTSPGSTGTATLNGATLAINAAGGGYAFGTKYTVLSATGGVNGAFANTTATSGPVTAKVSYDANDVFITLSQAFITMPVSASGNAKGLAHALNAYIADPPLPPAFQNLFNLSPAQLAEALAQLSGENNAGGGQQASFQMMNEFLLLMLNPFDADRGGGFSGAGFGAGSAVSQFAPDKERALPPEIARAYAAVTPPSERSIPFSARWNVWASAFGGTNNMNGDPNGTGSHNFNARTGGVAAGVDYKLTPDTLIGFALAGGGTSWGLSQSLGSGSSDAFQAGLYGSQRFGAWYVSGAVAFANYWASTTRTVTLPAVDTLNAGFNAQSWGGRAEAGYRIAWAPVNLAPYVAVQAQSFSTPNYTETATSGSNAFALSYASHTASVVRSELGSWLSKSYLLADNVLVTAFGRAAWAHDWEDTPQATATFVGLAPIATFIVNGAKPADNLAVMTAGAEIRMASGWALMGKFDGEFGEGTQTYVGTARARYAW
ncbi:MAG TPA: autotransporter-associated beta strand repeat-containing protein [Xanthobacteraceae bacterium]|nr:autotransporter-associated beta strand repeat-containing protein [Xanthobacteraceae bacterium]